MYILRLASVFRRSMVSRVHVVFPLSLPSIVIAIGVTALPYLDLDLCRVVHAHALVLFSTEENTKVCFTDSRNLNSHELQRYPKLA